MQFDIVTLFPQIFEGYVRQSLLAKALERELVTLRLVNLRDWSTDKHQSIDDRPYGGGPGMVIMAPPVVECVEDLQKETQEGDRRPAHVILTSPQGRRFHQRIVEQLATFPRLILICGRYEGFDQRVVDILQPDEISLGDFILNGGEVAAMAIVDAVIRLIPGVLGHEESSRDDSFSRGNRGLEYAQYTRPREFRGWQVPEVLLSGNHQEIAKWRQDQSQQRTAERRRDLCLPPQKQAPDTKENNA